MIHATPKESAEQATYFQWVDYAATKAPEFGQIFHPANGEFRPKTTANKLKKMGVRPGVPDILWLEPRGLFFGLAIELKVGKNQPTDHQWHWLFRLAKSGFAVGIAYGWEAAAQLTTLYYLDKLGQLMPKIQEPFFFRRATLTANQLWQVPDSFNQGKKHA